MTHGRGASGRANSVGRVCGLDDGRADATAPRSPVSSPPAARTARPRRAAAGKSAAATAVMAAQDEAAACVPSRDVILEKLFAPLTAAERQAWTGWSDIESEPAFFNLILRELGVQDATIFELFGVDAASIAHLPTPLGLIFLYKFVEDDDADDDAAYEDGPAHLWFANQITENACGTIAMLNIAMNCERLGLGDHLARFKAATQPLHPALRGHLLSTDAAIRSAHNAFARRIDMLLSDMALKREWAEACRPAAAPTAASRRRKKRAGDADEAAFHFIAYVPVGGDVWELNGMQEKPLKLGRAGAGAGADAVADADGDGDWTAMARGRIAARMAKYAESDETAIFNLLALCHTPTTVLPAGVGAGSANGATSALAVDDNDDESGVLRAAARQGDYTPAVHRWLKTLADKGVLRRLATGEADEPTSEMG